MIQHLEQNESSIKCIVSKIIFLTKSFPSNELGEARNERYGTLITRSTVKSEEQSKLAILKIFSGLTTDSAHQSVKRSLIFCTYLKLQIIIKNCVQSYLQEQFDIEVRFYAQDFLHLLSIPL